MLWILLTAAAAPLQVARNALQRGLVGDAGPWGATLVVVTAVAHEALLAVLIELAAAGRRVVLFTLAEEPPSYLPKITVFHLPHLVDDLIAPVQLIVG